MPCPDPRCSARCRVANPHQLILALAVAFSAAVSAGAANAQAPANEPPPAPAAELPLRHLTLYSSGVGYFEHAGPVPAGGEAAFRFTAEQLNDVLKSLLVRGATGGVAVSYPGQEPVEQRLAGFGVDLAHADSLEEVLRQLRGVQLVVREVGEPQEFLGRLIGVSAEERVVGDHKVTEYVVTLSKFPALRRIPLSQIEYIHPEDNDLNREIEKALTLLGNTRQRDAKPLTLSFEQSSDQAAVSYLLGMPLWKLSYRLDLTQDEPLLQGWAIVDNTTDTDWDGIAVTLVSGRPVSFIQNLYAPEFLGRPVVQPQRFAGLRPQEYAQGMGMGGMRMGVGVDESGLVLGEALRGVPQRSGRLGRSRAMALQDAAAEAEAAAPMAAGAYFNTFDDLASNVAPSAAGGDLGDLFAYHIDQPVTVGRGSSAMLPIVNAPIKAAPVSIYNQRVQPKHPMRGVSVRNTTDLKLDAGPVTVLDDGSYAGDAQLGFLAPGEARLLSYGLDLEMTVDPTVKSRTELVTAKLSRGVLELTHSTRYTQTYEARNAADEDRQLLVEHPRNPQRQLVSPDPDKAKPGDVEKTDTHHRFRLTVAAGKTTSLEVIETQPHTRTVQLASQNADQLAAYAGNGEFPDGVRDALAKAVRMQRAIEQTNRDIEAIQQVNREIEQEQNRIRNNMGRLDRNSALYKRYVAKLDAQETQLEDHAVKLEDLRQQLAEQQRQLADYLESLGD